MRTLARILLVIVGLILICAAALYAGAWYHRIQAERLLAAVKKLHIGATTQVEYEQAVRPFVTDAGPIREGDMSRPIPGAYVISPVPSWVWKGMLHMPRSIGSILSRWAVLEWTVFTVEPTFKDGKLTSLNIAEMQGEGRPLAGFVRIQAGFVPRLWPSMPVPFPGYTAHAMGGNGRVIFTRVDMDDRARPEERRRALDFRFHCFTAFRRCTDGRQLLDLVVTNPVP